MTKVAKQLKPDALIQSNANSKSMNDLIGASVSKNTRKAYGIAWQEWEGYRDNREASDELIAQWITSLYVAGMSPASIGLKIAGVRFSYKLMGLKIDAAVTARVLAGIRRSGKNRGRKQLQGISWGDSTLMSKMAMQDGDLKGYRDASLIAVMSDALLRVSELIGLKVGDVEACEDGTGRLHIRSSKTDQESEGSVLYLGADTMTMMALYLEARGDVGSNDPLFVSIRKGNNPTNKELSRQGIQKIIRARALVAGIDVENLNTHSFRIGSAVSLAQAGGSLVDLQQAGRWESPSMPARYTKKVSAGAGAVARLRYS